MLLKVRGDKSRTDGFAFWRLVTWLILLLAAYGCLQYALHAARLWETLQPLPASDAEDIQQLHRMLAWDVVYFLGAFALVVICAGAILRQLWSRAALQVAAVLLAVGWGLVGGLTLYSQWHQFSQGMAATNAQSGLDTASQLALDQMHRSVLMALAIKFLCVPVLAWLAWALGRPEVKGQFHGRRPR
ncbi:hypothetical protein [Dyella sp. C11]|uniref:hypothetical protein n=1 Tax=Dyella sp. C11 TaxID=2126991 RepID=UPI000D655C0D|nr:hypothetical protein [Dyella sp. C11]